MGHLTLNLLGGPEVRHGDQLLSFPTRKSLALLVYLAVEGGMHRREKLAALFWPESPDRSAHATLRNTLRLLRKEIDHDTPGNTSHLHVERQALGYASAQDATLDLDLLERALSSNDQTLLQQGASVCRGDFLAGFTLPDTPDFDDWASFQREYWHRRMVELLDRLARQQAEAGDPAAAVTTTSRWLALDPLSEAAYRLLMRLHFSLGDRTSALQSYAACCEMLRTEFDVEPSAETEAVAAYIRQESPQAAAGTVREREGPHRLGMQGPLVGRAQEHSQLVAAFHESRRGRTHAAILEGEAGIGKTRLAQEFLSWAGGQGAMVLEGRAFESGGQLPYQPVMDVLRVLLRRHLLTDGTLAEIWLAELTRLLPELQERNPDLPPPTTDEATAQVRLFEAVSQVGIAFASRRPLVLFFDDIQWADVASRDLLTYAARRWGEEEAPIMLLASARGTPMLRGFDRDGAIREWIEGLAREVDVSHLSLGPLSAEETGQWVTTLMGAQDGAAAGPASAARAETAEESHIEAFADWLFRETQGHPFYITETVKALHEAGFLTAQQVDKQRQVLKLAKFDDEEWRSQGFIAPGVREAVSGWLARLSETGFSLLAAAAVLGHDFRFKTLCEVAQVPPTDAVGALDELLLSRWLVEGTESPERRGRPYRFAHDKIRDIIYTEAGEARRILFHEQAYAYLTANPDGYAAPAAELAYHALAAGLDLQAFEHSVDAGDEAMQLFAVQDAIDFYEQARQAAQEHPHLTEQVAASRWQHFYRRLGRAYELIHDWDRARECYQEMQALGRTRAAPALEVAALNRLSTVCIQEQIDVVRSAAYLEEAVRLAEANGDWMGLAEAEWNLAQTRYYSLDITGALEHAERALAQARQLEHQPLIAQSLNIMGYLFDFPGPMADLARLHEIAGEAAAIYRALGNPAMEIDSLVLQASGYIHAGESEAAVGLLERTLEMSRAIENPWSVANSAFNLAVAYQECGRYGDALALANTAVETTRAGGITMMIAGTLTVRGDVYLTLLAPEKALADYQEAEQIFGDLPHPNFAHLMAVELCACHFLLGDVELAVQYARQVYDIGKPWLFSWFHHWCAVAALAEGGDPAEARRVSDRFADIIGDNQRHRIVYLRGQAALAQAEEELGAASKHLEEALDLAVRMNLLGEQWPLLAELGTLYRRMGEAQRAQSLRAEAGKLIRTLAASIQDETWRNAFLEAEPVRSILEEG